MSIMKTKDRRRAALDARVEARNLANSEAHKLSAVLAEAFGPLVGTAVTKNDGGILHKHMHRLPDFAYSRGLSYYRHSSNYSLAWVVKVCVSIGGQEGCVYEEAVVYVGKMDGNVLTHLEEPFEGRTDFTAEEILEKRVALEAARDALDDARSALCPFGEHDR